MLNTIFLHRSHESRCNLHILNECLNDLTRYKSGFSIYTLQVKRRVHDEKQIKKYVDYDIIFDRRDIHDECTGETTFTW